MKTRDQHIEFDRNYCEHYKPQPGSLAKDCCELGCGASDRMKQAGAAGEPNMTPCIGGHKTDNVLSLCPSWVRRSIEHAEARADSFERMFARLQDQLSVTVARAEAATRERDAALAKASDWQISYIQKDEALKHSLDKWADYKAQLGAAIKRVDETEEALRLICIDAGGFDPSDGEGTRPDEVVAHVKAQTAQLAQVTADFSAWKRLCQADTHGYIEQIDNHRKWAQEAKVALTAATRECSKLRAALEQYKKGDEHSEKEEWGPAAFHYDEADKLRDAALAARASETPKEGM